MIPTDDEWNKLLDDDVMELQTHLLHSLIHSNGFGHLVCINGIEGGSKYLSMWQIQGQWILDCFMAFLMGTLGLVGGATDSAVEALEWQSTILSVQLNCLVRWNLK